MNDKGFTLVELLAILIILTTILMIAIPSITSSIERNKQKIKLKKLDIIETAAIEYNSKYKNKFQDYYSFYDGYCCLDVEDIRDVGLLSDDDLLDADKSDIGGFVCYDNEDKKYSYSAQNKTRCVMNDEQ